MSTTTAGVQRSSIQAATGAVKRRSRRIAIDIVGFLDVAAVVAGGMIPAAVYAVTGGLAVDWLKHLQMCLVAAIIVYGCLRHYKMYDTGQMHDLPVQPGRLAASLGIAFVAVLGLGLPFAPKEMHLWIWYTTWITASFMLLLDVRCLARLVLARMTRAGAFDARVAVYGSGNVARRVEEHLRNPDLGIRFAGVFDDRHDARRLHGGTQPDGRLDDLVAAARAGNIDRIIIALPHSADQRTVSIARKLEHLPVSLHVVTHIASDLVDAGPAHCVSSLGSVGLIDVKEKPIADWSRVLKGVEDYAIGGVLLLLSLPLMALIAIAIRLDSPGPVLFRQRRRGLNHRVIEVLKFRTMHVLEDGEGLKQATRNDPRVTRVGRILRRLSLDELPQLLNVLRGEMSLVGPRPHALAHDDHFEETVARYVNRQQVKPGITGLAQVHGFRGETERPEKIEQRIALDLKYVNTWSLWLDLQILALTPARILFSKNAY
ncbi:MAG: undecaprenyl-phosphate glucose phosphotransferase [Hyphomicrobiaceae bacterium]|nr:undecaprenyl-phosphate glucose phosphotransferase [Hyphomicrobiaceae bacterium]